MKRTRPLAGWSGLAILLSGLGPLSAQTLVSENFDAAAPGGALTNRLPGTGLRVTSGNVDVIGTILNGAWAAYSVCPAGPVPANNCLDLNGLNPGAVSTGPTLVLTAGTHYVLNFSAAGSIVGPPAPPYTFTVSLGASGPTSYSVPANGSFMGERFSYTPVTDQPNAALTLISTTNLPGNAQYGPLIDNLTLAAGPAIPPPLTENFNLVRPGSNQSGVLAGSRFAVIAGNIDVLGSSLNGAAAGFFSCPPGGIDAGNCIDLNGDQPATIEATSLFHLIAGTQYAISFELAGNVVDGTHTSYDLTVSLGGSGAIGFSAAPGAGFVAESFFYTPAVDEPEARLLFAATPGGGDRLYGPILDHIQVTGVPEPAGLWMLLPLLGILGGVRRRR